MFYAMKWFVYNVCAIRVCDVRNCNDIEVHSTFIEYVHGTWFEATCSELVHYVRITIPYQRGGPGINNVYGRFDFSQKFP